jgi:small-conductance mechanosensitive channel
MAQGMLVTRLKTPKNVEVTVPNSNLLGVHLINYSTQARERSLILHTSVTIGYDAPWRQVHALLRKAAGMTPEILKDPEPFVLQKSLDDFYVSYQLNAYTENPGNQEKIYSDLHKNIQDTFNEFGVQIMSPNYIADRARPTVVPKDHWYPPPAPKPGDPHADS